MQVIEFFDNTGEIIVTRFPFQGSGEFQLGSQLVIQESQVALFFKDGRALDLFHPGRHTLITQNLPLLVDLCGLPFDGKSPFRCLVYFISTKTFINLNWGTPSPVLFRDTDFHMVNLRAHGVYSIRIRDPRIFLQTIIGTRGLQTTYALEEYFRTIIVGKLNEVLGRVMKSILDLPAQYSQIVHEVKQVIHAEFEQYGIELVDLLIEAITVPDEVQLMINRAAGIAAQDTDKYRAIYAADAMLEAAKNQGGEAMGKGISLGLGMETAHQIQQFIMPAQRTPLAPTVNSDEIKEKLRVLKELQDDGIISLTEFEEQKRKLLAQM